MAMIQRDTTNLLERHWEELKLDFTISIAMISYHQANIQNQLPKSFESYRKKLYVNKKGE